MDLKFNENIHVFTYHDELWMVLEEVFIVGYNYKKFIGVIAWSMDYFIKFIPCNEYFSLQNYTMQIITKKISDYLQSKYNKKQRGTLSLKENGEILLEWVVDIPDF